MDLTATVRTILKINARLEKIDELAGRIRAHSDQFGGNLAGHVLDAAERGAELKLELEQRRDEAELQSELARMELRDQLSQWRDDLDKLLSQPLFGQRRILRAFPKLRSLNHAAALERLRRRPENR